MAVGRTITMLGEGIPPGQNSGSGAQQRHIVAGKALRLTPSRRLESLVESLEAKGRKGTEPQAEVTDAVAMPTGESV